MSVGPKLIVWTHHHEPNASRLIVCSDTSTHHASPFVILEASARAASDARVEAHVLNAAVKHPQRARHDGQRAARNMIIVTTMAVLVDRGGARCSCTGLTCHC